MLNEEEKIMGKFLAFILSPFKWIKCICYLMCLDWKFCKETTFIPIIEQLPWHFRVFIKTTLKTKKFDDYYNEMKKNYLNILNGQDKYSIKLNIQPLK